MVNPIKQAKEMKGALTGALKVEADKVIQNWDHNEGKLTTRIESQTAKIPSISWMGLAVGSMALSASLQALSNKKELSNFVGLWAPCFLLIGIYNKLVKLEGSDQHVAKSRMHAE